MATITEVWKVRFGGLEDSRQNSPLTWLYSHLNNQYISPLNSFFISLILSFKIIWIFRFIKFQIQAEDTFIKGNWTSIRELSSIFWKHRLQRNDQRGEKWYWSIWRQTGCRIIEKSVEISGLGFDECLSQNGRCRNHASSTMPEGLGYFGTGKGTNQGSFTPHWIKTETRKLSAYLQTYHSKSQGKKVWGHSALQSKTLFQQNKRRGGARRRRKRKRWR